MVSYGCALPCCVFGPNYVLSLLQLLTLEQQLSDMECLGTVPKLGDADLEDQASLALGGVSKLDCTVC